MVLTMDQDVQLGKAGAVATPATAEKIGLPVGGIEELLTFPMPRWKRAIDILAAATLSIILAPVLFLAALAIKLSSPGPVIFTQKRSGLGGKPFLIYKFRTMIVGAEKQQQELRKLNEQDGPAFKLTRDPRVTRVGSFLRKTSIDELPQLWNILVGNMSLVGPRPLPISEQEGCEQWQRHRLNVTPGLTCIWQVKGRSQVSFAEWVRMDVEYIRRRTLVHDFIILFSTIPAVLLRRGAR
jgi:lipopolysaccharide/colanic/teichoic acid biosynthesis glycosyltransferase